MWHLDRSIHQFKSVALALLATIFVMVNATDSFADDPSLPAPPVHQVIDSNGVNLSTGTPTVAGPSISIGQPGQSGLTYSVQWTGRIWDSNLDSSVSYETVNPNHYTVNLMGQSATFTLSGTTFTSNENMGATLIKKWLKLHLHHP